MIQKPSFDAWGCYRISSGLERRRAPGLRIVGFVAARQIAAVFESHGDLLPWVELCGVCRGSQRVLVRLQQPACQRPRPQLAGEYDVELCCDQD
jgi:hypothetical protein